MSQDTIKRLTDLKNKIDSMKVKEQSTKDMLASLQGKLLKDFGVNDIDEGEDLLEKWGKELKKKEQELEELVRKLEEVVG